MSAASITSSDGYSGWSVITCQRSGMSTILACHRASFSRRGGKHYAER